MRCRPARERRGVTLLELLVVLLITGILTAVAAARFTPEVLGDVSAHIEGRRLALDLLRLQRAAVMTGDNHYLGFTTSGGSISGYQMYRRIGGGVIAVDSLRPFSERLEVTSSDAQLEFTFEGQALSPYQVTLSGANRSAQLDVIPVTGAVRVTYN